MTKAEKALCHAAERRWHWGTKLSTPLVSRKFDYWNRRLLNAATAVGRERGTPGGVKP